MLPITLDLNVPRLASIVLVTKQHMKLDQARVIFTFIYFSHLFYKM